MSTDRTVCIPALSAQQFRSAAPRRITGSRTTVAMVAFAVGILVSTVCALARADEKPQKPVITTHSAETAHVAALMHGTMVCSAPIISANGSYVSYCTITK